MAGIMEYAWWMSQDLKWQDISFSIQIKIIGTKWDTVWVNIEICYQIKFLGQVNHLTNTNLRFYQWTLGLYQNILGRLNMQNNLPGI